MAESILNVIALYRVYLLIGDNNIVKIVCIIYKHNKSLDTG